MKTGQEETRAAISAGQEKMEVMICEIQSDETEFEETTSKQVEGLCKELDAEIQGTQLDM
jgi:hypothetical protein